MIFKPLDHLIQLLDPNNQMVDGLEETVEDECTGVEEGVALRLHDGFLVAQVFGWGAGIR